MRLADWRTSRSLTLAEMARRLGISGKNPGATLSRIECGMRQPEADFVERIGVLTAGEVSAGDMHEVRLEWLRVNQPEKFDRPAPEPMLAEAAE